MLPFSSGMLMYKYFLIPVVPWWICTSTMTPTDVNVDSFSPLEKKAYRAIRIKPKAKSKPVRAIFFSVIPLSLVSNTPFPV